MKRCNSGTLTLKHLMCDGTTSSCRTSMRCDLRAESSGALCYCFLLLGQEHGQNPIPKYDVVIKNKRTFTRISDTTEINVMWQYFVDIERHKNTKSDCFPQQREKTRSQGSRAGPKLVDRKNVSPYPASMKHEWGGSRATLLRQSFAESSARGEQCR